jgi:hypothetical protein
VHLSVCEGSSVIKRFCIVQDNRKDWEIESAKMADIYQHAMMTLAATASSGDTEGCYSTNLYIAKRREIVLPGGKLSGIAVRQRLRHWNKTTANNPAHFPLLSRGWVLQERLLSPRILHFCESELVWECREESLCECGGLNQEESLGGWFYNLTTQYEKSKVLIDVLPDESISQSFWDRFKRRSQVSQDDEQLRESQTGERTPRASRFSLRKSWLGSGSAVQVATHPTSVSPNSFKIDWETRVEGIPSTVGADDIPDFVNHYHRLVEQYTALGLTRATDRLVAFSGICARIQHFRGDFLAGLWSDSLCFDLMWHIDLHELWKVKPTRPVEYCGPTWSWASVMASVQYWPDVSNYQDTVEHFLTELAKQRDVEGERTAFETPLILNRAKIQYEVKVSGHNAFGSVDAGVLIVEASCMPACLQMIDAGVGLSYSLLVSTDTSEGALPVVIPFYADYSLELTGPHKLYDFSELILLLIHPKVSLVLRKKVQNDKYVYLEGHQAWERVGIARLSERLHDTRSVDWMQRSEVKTLKLVRVPETLDIAPLATGRNFWVRWKAYISYHTLSLLLYPA